MQFALKCLATARSITYCKRKGMQTALRKSMGRIDFGRGIAIVKSPQMRNNIALWAVIERNDQARCFIGELRCNVATRIAVKCAT